ncbi:hypothetical protein LCGC14_2195610, partial [marine sediment metagenome]
MSLLVEALNPTPMAAINSPPAYDDYWYSNDPLGYLIDQGGGGLKISPETMFKCGAVLAALRFLGDQVSMCPPSTSRKKEQGSEDLPLHYSQRLLRNPNRWQTGNRWRHLNVVRLKLWGNAYNEIRGGPRSWAEELRPIHPAHIRVTQQRPDGSLIYRHNPLNGLSRTLGQERVLHFRDVSVDGIGGIEIFAAIRNTVAIALMANQHALTFLRKGTRISGLLVPTGGPLTDEQRDSLVESVNKDFSGTNKTGTIGVLPHGIELKELTKSHRDAQFVELADRTVGQILRQIGVPGVVVGWMGDKTSTYASAKEYFSSGGLRNTLLPLLANLEAEEEKSLLLEAEADLQIKHNMDAVLRAAWTERIAGLVRAAGGPIWSVNEARAIDDFDALEDERYDRPHIPSNMMGGGEPDDDPDTP